MLKRAAPILASLNAEETIAYFTEKMGFKLDANWDGYLIFSRDDIGIHHWPTSDPAVPKSTGCYVYVTEIRELFAEYEAKGIIHPNGKLERKPWGLLQFAILDNNGNIISFGEPLE